ncbi:toll/interleukin-1 receptor domain-containing adapter protein isoform X2 [Pyxicephalus adspersus]
MGANESKSKPTSSSSRSQPIRSVAPRTISPASEKVHTWPSNSARWQKQYDVYICSSDKDILYAKELLTYLQEQPESLRCFLPMRDMNPGGAIPTEILDGAENSHCWIMLLTFNSLSDQWCQYQMHQFLTMAPHGNGRLIPILVQLPFEHYPKELRHMYCFKDSQGDQTVFRQLGRAIVSYLTKLPTVSTDQDPREEANSSTSESRPPSSRQGTDSQVTSSQTQESTSDISMRSSVAQRSIGDTSIRSSMTQESTNSVSVGSDINREATRDPSMQVCLQQEATSYTSMRSSIQMSNTSVESTVNQEASLQSSYTGGSTCNTSGKGSLDQDPTNNTSTKTSVTQDFTNDIPMTSPQVPSAYTLTRSPVTQESTNTKPKPNMDLSLKTYETLASNINTLTINCKAMESSSSRISGGPEYTNPGADDRSYKKETTYVGCQGFGSDSQSSYGRALTSNKVSVSLSSNIYASCGGVQEKKEIVHGGLYSSCGETNAEMNSLEFQRDPYRSCRMKTKNEASQSLQSNIYTSGGGANTENKDSGSDLCICSEPQDNWDTLRQLDNICTSSGQSKDTQSLQKDRYSRYGETEARKGQHESLSEDLYSSCGQTENEDSPGYPSDINSSWDGKRAHMDVPSLQIDVYTGSMGNLEDRRTSCSFQSDLYTSQRTTSVELKKAQIHDHCVGLQVSNKLHESLQDDIYTSSDRTQIGRKDFQARSSDLCWGGTNAQTTHQDFPGPYSNLLTGCTDQETEGKESDHSYSDIYTSCTGAKASGSDSCIDHGNIYCRSTPAITPTMHIHRYDSSRPASEAADKT